MTELGQIQSLHRKSLHEELVERLRTILVESNLKPGEKVPERALCERLGVSRTPMREALKVLASDGLVSLINNRGAVIRGLSEQDVKDLFSVIGALEALAGEMACENLGDSQVSKLEILHKKMVEHYENDDLPGYAECNRQIHNSILKASGNQVLIKQYELLSIRLRRIRFKVNRSPERWKQAIEEHEEMMKSLKNRDGRKLASQLKQHLQNKMEYLIQSEEFRSTPEYRGH